MYRYQVLDYYYYGYARAIEHSSTLYTVPVL